jgi:DNA-directed RNA polymerase subunit RPC12/RpoP
METYRCIRCGKVFEGHLLDGIYTCDYCEGELYTEEFYKGKVKEGNDMNFIDAIGKYEAITRDGGTTVYFKNSEGNIIRKVNGKEGGFLLNYDILCSRGWVEHQEHKLILPERAGHYHSYMYIEDGSNKIYVDSDCRFDEDTNRLKIFNYFTDKELAQYIADRQLLDRIELVLYKYNKDNMDDKTLTKLINEYIDTHYKEVLNRVLDYQDKM